MKGKKIVKIINGNLYAEPIIYSVRISPYNL